VTIQEIVAGFDSKCTNLPFQLKVGFIINTVL